MLNDFQNHFTCRLSRKFEFWSKTIIKRLTTSQTRCYTTLWNISVKIATTCVVTYDISQGKLATRFRSGETLDYYSITNLLLSPLWRILKISQHLAKLWVRKLIAQASCSPGHCPAERWRTRLRSDVWRAGTVVTASRLRVGLVNLDCVIDNDEADVLSTICVTRWLMSSMTER